MQVLPQHQELLDIAENIAEMEAQYIDAELDIKFGKASIYLEIASDPAYRNDRARKAAVDTQYQELFEPQLRAQIKLGTEIDLQKRRLAILGSMHDVTSLPQ